MNKKISFLIPLQPYLSNPTSPTNSIFPTPREAAIYQPSRLFHSLLATPSTVEIPTPFKKLVAVSCDTLTIVD